MILSKRPTSLEWRKWFAWYPVRTEDEKWVWLETVERKIYHARIQNVKPPYWIIYKQII